MSKLGHYKSAYPTPVFDGVEQAEIIDLHVGEGENQIDIVAAVCRSRVPISMENPKNDVTHWLDLYAEQNGRSWASVRIPLAGATGILLPMELIRQAVSDALPEILETLGINPETLIVKEGE